MTSAIIPPDFIRFLVSNKPKFDCYFKVGNVNQGEPERIGAVKLMLMAHSEVFRAELEYSEIKEKEDAPVKDIHPDTFRGMLKYVYGYDTTQDMVFEEADNLLYVAEKYLMKTLKDKLALRLMKLLNYDNICSLLNNPACHTHLELNAAITDILRHETDKVLASPQFLWMNADGFLRILEQDALAVTELELWRAAISWAKHRADSEDGPLLRHQLPAGLTQHLRLCTLSDVEFCREVATTEVLTSKEVCAICRSIARNEKAQDLGSFSNETKPRKVLKKKNIINGELSVSKLSFSDMFYSYTYIFILHTKEESIELLPLVCQSKDHNSTNLGPQTHKVYCTTIISTVSIPVKPPLTFSADVECGADFVIPLAVDGRNITLQPDTAYKVTMVVRGLHKSYYSRDSGSSMYANDHLRFDITRTGDCYRFPSTKLQYNAVTTAE